MMRTLYEKNSVNYSRLETDKFFADYENRYSYSGILDKTYKFIEEFQLTDKELWKRFVQQFREDADAADRGWRGEYWGKMMRGAAFVYTYTKNEKLYEILEETVEDMISAADELGRISTYPQDNEFCGWDLWSRKYVLLGMQYFLEICKNSELKDRIILSMRGQVDYLAERIGEDDKIRITHTSNFWRGLNSSSILEPVVRLYSLTREVKYLEFAEHIIRHGCIDTGNVFELAYENGLYPYQYPVTKAYEMISCFEGLLEYYRLTKNEKHKTAVVNFADKVLESDFTVIGCGGCTHELFDNSRARQTNTTNGAVSQETCVTVTFMKFLYQVYLVTGDPKYIDAFETSLYNAYLGAVNTDGKVCEEVLEPYPDCKKVPMPFDSYSPLVADRRGKAVGGLKVMSDNYYYGCCACIGSAGIGLVPKVHLVASEKGFAMNLFISGTAVTATPSGKKVTFETVTDYPANGKVSVKLTLDGAERFEILVRNPEWSKTTIAHVNGEKVDVQNGYIRFEKEWVTGDEIALELDMRTYAVFPKIYGEQVIMTGTVLDRDRNLAVIPVYDKQDPLAEKHIALRRGPLMLAQDDRLGYSVDTPIDVKVNADTTVDVKLSDGKSPYESIVEVEVPLTDGAYMTVTDYASAGKDWESRMAVWFLTK